MRALLQRVSRAEVRVEGEVTARIGRGLVILLGIGPGDDESVGAALARRIAELRIFRDDEGRTNRSLLDVAGEALVVSQFTLYGDCRKGRRPSFDDAAPPELARPLYEYFVERLRAAKLVVETGVFQASMKVSLVNDGPFTILLDSTQLSS